MRVFEPLKPPAYGGWETERHCKWPQELIIRLEKRSQVQHITIVCLEDRSIPEVEVYIGDGISGSFLDCPYRHAGSGRDIVGPVPSQFAIYGIGNFLKLVFPK